VTKKGCPRAAVGREIVFRMTAEDENLPGPPDDAANLRFPELSGRSREVLETLARQKGRADHFFEGAMRALADRSNPVRPESAAYCLRELIEELERAALAPKAGPGLGELFDDFQPLWEAAERRPENNGLVDNCDPAVFAADQFLKDAAAGYASRRDRAQTTFSELDPVQRQGPPDTYEARVKALLEFRDVFNDVLHGGEPTALDWFESRVEGFETFLLSWFRPRTFDDFREIDELLAEGPPGMTQRSRSEKVELIRASAANLDYFFAHLQDASWLPFLLEEGFFRTPTPPKTWTTDEGQSLVQFPSWPESQYLARVAAEAPELVVEAIERIPETSNPRVHEDIITAATALPGEPAARLATRERRWLSHYDGHLVSFPGSAGDLLAHLAEEGQVKAAFGLAGALLKISAAPESEGRTSRRRAVALISEWEYGKIIEKAWPPLMEAEPEKAFCFLCHRLAAVIDIGFVEGSSFDPTYMWRSAIEDHAQNTGHSLLDTLVDAVRDTALATAEKGPEGRDMVLAELARHDAPLFRRLALFVLARCGSVDQVADALAHEEQIDDFNVWHEYAELLKARFRDLNADQQARILALIAADSNRELTPTQEERGVTKKQFELRRRYWRLERYALIEDHLGGDARVDCEALVAEFGKPKHPTFRSRITTSWTGPKSPYTAEELLEMGPAGALEALRTWDPEEGSEDPSPEGLGRVLEGAVEKDPAGFAEIAADFAELDPDYVRGLLSGLAKAAREKVAFAWKPVLDLCEQVVARETAGAESGDEDAPANWLRRSIVSLLSDGFNDADAEIPFEERTRAWGLIEPHFDDPDPSPQRDEGNDPATVAINSVRGETLHAAVRYALWVERALEAEEAFQGIDSLPELAAAVDHRLDPAIEPSLAIRAVLGQWFVQFVRIDEKWAESLVPRLFPSDPVAAASFSASWNAYVVFNRAWISVFEILREAYLIAVERFEEVDEDRYMAGSPREHLGEHLFFLCFSDSVELSADGIFARFWKVAPAQVRKHLIRDVGWSLEHGSPQLSEEVRARMVETWEWIFNHSQEEHDSLGAFGAWFGAHQFDDDWLLAQGRRVLELGVPLDPDHVVYDSLPRMAGNHPREVVEILRLMIVTDPEEWSVLGSVDEVRQTLATALSSGDDDVCSDAIAVLNLLGAKGMGEFRDLMP